MASTSETGHAKNVANLQKLIEQVTVFANYNPPVANLEITNLQTLYTNSLAKLNEVEEKRNANKNAIHLRQVAYENLKPTTTKIVNLPDILGITKGTLDQAKSLNKLIQGGQKKPSTPPEEGKEPETPFPLLANLTHNRQTTSVFCCSYWQLYQPTLRMKMN